jgi:uncharacterized damage-inducible protein DinB
MASTIERLRDQLRLSFEGEAWHGPSVEEALRGVTPAIAAMRPIPNVHSIWELVLHLAATYDVVLRRMGGDGRPLSTEEDWPTVPEPTDANWRRDCDRLRSVNRQIREALASFSEDRLDHRLVEQAPYSAFVQFIGITQHDLYHAGQIVILKRVALAQPSA